MCIGTNKPMGVVSHYEANLDSNQITTGLKQAYPEGANKYQLAPIDQLHIGGIKASEKLLSNLEPSDQVLEIGSGCGGLMRLAQEQEVDITGLDISHGLNVLNGQLFGISSYCRNSGSPKVITGDAHCLPFPDECFSVVVMQHSLLNMPDTLKVLLECKRVLKPSGKVVLHEVFQGEHGIPLSFPVPWASTHEKSCLITEQKFKNLLSPSGFQLDRSEDWTAEALNWRKRQQSKEESLDAEALNISAAMIFGEPFKLMAKNVVANLSTGAIRVLEIVLSQSS